MTSLTQGGGAGAAWGDLTWSRVVVLAFVTGALHCGITRNEWQWYRWAISHGTFTTNRVM